MRAGSYAIYIKELETHPFREAKQEKEEEENTSYTDASDLPTIRHDPNDAPNACNFGEL